MKQILVVGKYDKTDLMFYLSKILSIDFKVLLVEVSQNKNYEFSFPKMDANFNIHQHDQFDVIENMKDYSSLKEFLNGTDYDFVLIDIDVEQALLNWPNADLIYLVTSYENPVIQNNIKLLNAFCKDKSDSSGIEITKVICEAVNTFDEEYINDLLGELPINWKPSLVYYPDERDQALKIMNQHSTKVTIKKLSGYYKKVMKQMVSSILEIDTSSVDALWKRAERRK